MGGSRLTTNSRRIARGVKKIDTLCKENRHPPRPRSAPEEALALQIRALGLPQPVREYVAIPGRRYRLDFAWPVPLVGIEVHGGVWAQGRHQRAAGYMADREKINLLVLAGWRVLEIPAPWIRAGTSLSWLERLRPLLV